MGALGKQKVKAAKSSFRLEPLKRQRCTVGGYAVSLLL